MFLLLTELLLVTGAGVLLILRAMRRGTGLTWVLTVAVSVAALTTALLLRTELPATVGANLWTSNISSARFASFSISEQNWPLWVAALSVLLSMHLSAPGKARFPDAWGWALSFGLVALGLLAMSPDGPLTLVFLWATLDLVEAVRQAGQPAQASGLTRSSFALTLRLASLGLVLVGYVLGGPGAAPAPFDDGGTTASISWLQAAALLRVCSFAIPRRARAGSAPEATAILLELVAGTAAVAFLANLQTLEGSVILGMVSAIVTLAAGWMFLRVSELPGSHTLWIMGMASLAVTASIQGNPTGAVGWACCILIFGGSMFVTAPGNLWARRGLVVGVLITSTLPYTLTASAWTATTGVALLALPFSLVGQAMLLAGAYHHVMRAPTSSAMRVEVIALRGVQHGALILPLTLGVTLGLWGWPGALRVGTPLVAYVVLLLAVAFVWAKGRLPGMNPGADDWSPPWMGILSTALRNLGSGVSTGAQRLTTALTAVMEGESGVMWGLLFLVLIVSLISGNSN